MISRNFFVGVSVALLAHFSSNDNALAASVKSSECPPVTNVSVGGAASNGMITMRISATNKCACRIKFEACSAENKPKCNHVRIPPGETRTVVVLTPTAEGKADFKWSCR